MIIARRYFLYVLLLIALGCGRATGGDGSSARTAAPRSPAQRVVLISLDGFRWDYIQRAPAVRLRELAARGVRAERMIAVFPTKTFPNHYSIVTGLFAEEHGIVANNIRDPELGLFSLRDTLAQSEPRWWGGEPIWATVERQGLRAASAAWPGSETTGGSGYAPSWWARYWHDEPHASRITKVLDWLALPSDSGPVVITAYFPDVDSESHAHGTDAWQTDSAIARVDRAVGAIMDGIAAGGYDDVNLIIVSDHGMTNTSTDRTILIDELMDVRDAEIVDWTPVAAIAPTAGNTEKVYAALKDRHPRLQVYRKGDVPARWHFNTHPRITEIVAVADEGWTITTRTQRARWIEQGRTGGATHGYDPYLISMGATFIAAGPGIAVGRVVPPFRNVHVYSLMAHLLGVQPARTSGSLDSVRAVLR